MNVWVLVLDTDHGTDVSAFSSAEAAQQDLWDYVKSQYRQEETLTEWFIKASREEIIQDFFDSSDSWYVLNEVEVQ